MNHKILSLLLTEEEMLNLHSNVEKMDGPGLLEELLRSNYLLMADWKGETNRFDIGNFIKQRASVIKGEIVIDIDVIYSKAEKDAAEIGDLIPNLLKSLKQILKKYSLAIMLLDRGNDQYYIALIEAKNTTELKKLSNPFWKFVEFGINSGGVLYTVNCTCGGMNVWQLKRGEVLVDDVCQDCGMVLFDKKGQPTLPVIKEYF